MLEVQNLSVAFGRKTILRDISFFAESGKCLAILGRNGAGKTSLVRALAGLLPMRGAALLDGADLAKMLPAQRAGKIGYVAQDLTALNARMSVLELLVLAQNSHATGWRAPAASLTAGAAILERFNIADLAHAMPAELSGGQKQLVALSLALVRGPRLLILDEPTAALDIANQLHLLATVRHYTAEHGIATLMILHDLNLVTRYADTALLLRDGKISACGAVADMLTRERIADIYGVDCQIEAISGGHRIIYPLARI